MNRQLQSQLPAEHGSWAFLLLPVLAALALRPSAAGGWLALSALAAFLMRMPLKRTFRAGRILQRDRLWLAAELAVGGLGLALALRGMPLVGFLLLLVSMLIGAWVLWVDLRGCARTPSAEYLAILAPCLFGGALLAAGGASLQNSLALATGAFLSLAAPVSYLRALLAHQRGLGSASPLPMLLFHGIACLVACGLQALSGMGWLWPAWMCALALRAAVEPRIFLRLPGARILGMREALVCAVSAGALVLSFHRVAL